MLEQRDRKLLDKERDLDRVFGDFAGFMAAARELLRSRQTCGTGTDHGNLLAGLARRRLR